MTNYQEVRVKLTNTQLNKLKSAAKNKTRTILRLIKKNFEDEELPHKLFPIIRQTTKARNAFSNNMSTDVKFSKGQISTISQSGEFLGKTLGKLGKKILLDLAVSLAKGALLKLGPKATSSVLDKFENKKMDKEQ